MKKRLLAFLLALCMALALLPGAALAAGNTGPVKIEDALEDVLFDNPASAEEICAAAANLGGGLKDALKEADPTAAGRGVLDIISELESRVKELSGITMGASVVPALADAFPQSGIRFYGAALNMAGAGRDRILLRVTAPENPGAAIPARYNAVSAARFNMAMQGLGADPSQPLAVPVKIILPVPANLQADQLALLRLADSMWEEQVVDSRFQQEGRWYIAFTTEYFGDFALAEPVKSAPGSDNSDNSNNNSDNANNNNNNDDNPGGIVPAVPEEPGSTVPEPVMPFADVHNTDWFHDDVYYVWERSLMGGVTETEFSPGATTSRAMIWTVLARVNGVSTDAAPGSAWYERGMLWAVDKGLTDGTDPMSDITREQLAAMLWRDAGCPAAAGLDLSGFSDAASVSGYALDAVRWAAGQGILNGSGGLINPRGTASRAEVAAMAARYDGMN